jgi:hypothetical protein
MRRIAALAAILVPLVAVALVADEAASTPSNTMTELSPAQVEVLEWALDLYAEAGLDLPPIDFVAHADHEPCEGFDGYHRVEGGRSTIHLCGPFERHLAEPLYLHELAHAWDVASLGDDRRQAFLELRGLDRWRSEARPWHELGAEQAAEILVWGLRDRPMRVARIAGTSCAELQAGYDVLTGEEPLHGYTDFCAA